MQTKKTKEDGMENRRRIIINSENLEARVALINGECLEEYQVERKNKANIVGAIFIGKVVNIQKALQAVFVDIGTEKNAFMHFEDMLPATFDDINISKRDQKRIKLDDIPVLFPVGSILFVQVVKDSIGTKGPRVTTNITIPGRFLVFLPFSNHIGISKKITEQKERERLKKILFKFPIPEGVGLICRTVAEDRKASFLKNEFSMLLEKWNAVERTKKESSRPRKVYEEPSLIEKSLRDFFTEEIEEVVIDDKQNYDYIKSFTEKILGKKIADRIILHKKAEPIFEYYRIEEKISKIFERTVSLPSGGYICIDETEALIAIDVNTGSARGGAGRNSDVIFNTNMEATDEIARQLRLRNIGGLVVIDFIDMDSYADNEQVLRRMRKLLRNDKARANVLPISQFGLMQMTRQRDQQSLLDRIYDPCPYCKGTGKVKSPLSISVEIQRQLKELLRRKSYDKNLSVRVIMNPTVLARLKNEDERFLRELEDKYGKDLSFRADPMLHIEEFKVMDTVTGEDFFK